MNIKYRISTNYFLPKIFEVTYFHENTMDDLYEMVDEKIEKEVLYDTWIDAHLALQEQAIKRLGDALLEVDKAKEFIDQVKGMT